MGAGLTTGTKRIAGAATSTVSRCAAERCGWLSPSRSGQAGGSTEPPGSHGRTMPSCSLTLRYSSQSRPILFWW